MKNVIYFGMATIGIYDSGIGGLTTLLEIEKLNIKCDVKYYADNFHHPFGNKSAVEIERIVQNGIETIKKECDYVVLACNTASTTINNANVLKLLPPLNVAKHQAKNNTLLMATPLTVKNIQQKYHNLKLSVANTDTLATMIEDVARNQNNRLDMSALQPYLYDRLKNFIGVKNVILGCSHYPFCKKEIEKVLGPVNFFDGNQVLCKQLEMAIKTHQSANKLSIDFAFSGKDESAFYKRVYQLLKNADFNK